MVESFSSSSSSRRRSSLIISVCVTFSGCSGINPYSSGLGRAVFLCSKDFGDLWCQSAFLLAVHAEQITDRAQVGAAHRQGLFQSFPHIRCSLPAFQQQHIDHHARSGRTAYAFRSHLPEAVITARPAALCAALFESGRTGQCARLLLECVQIVLQLQHFLLALVAAFMPCHAPSSVPDLHVGGVDLGLGRCAHRQRRRVEVGQHLYASRSG